MVIRAGLPIFLAVVVTLLLFYIMQSLIAGSKMKLDRETIDNIVDIVLVREERVLEIKERTPKKPPLPDDPPTDVPPQVFTPEVGDSGYAMRDIGRDIGPDISGSGMGASDGEYLPIVKVQPSYPRRALSRGMSGWVIVEFTVTDQGMVRNPRVVQNCAWIGAEAKAECGDSPNDIFDRAALRAAGKFKYKPKVSNGEPVATTGVQNKITFELVE